MARYTSFQSTLPFVCMFCLHFIKTFSHVFICQKWKSCICWWLGNQQEILTLETFVMSYSCSKYFLNSLTHISNVRLLELSSFYRIINHRYYKMLIYKYENDILDRQLDRILNNNTLFNIYIDI